MQKPSSHFPYLQYLYTHIEHQQTTKNNTVRLQFYRSTRIFFDPTYAVNVKTIIKGLRDYGQLDDDITILKLIDSFNRFQLLKAERIQNTSSNIDILQRGIMIIGMTMNSTCKFGMMIVPRLY